MDKHSHLDNPALVAETHPGALLACWCPDRGDAVTVGTSATGRPVRACPSHADEQAAIWSPSFESAVA